jgi:hypothetical protein
VHLRDIKALGHGLKIKTVNCELGQGFNDIPGIIHSAQKGGAKYLALEQKTSSPYKSLKASLDYLKDNNLFI